MQKNITSTNFATRLITWYHLNARTLPWRQQPTPYTTWLSEILLQQTRIKQGLPYYHKFITTYPTLNHLAQATEKEILHLWQGLGYYRRALNLLRCAQEIITNHNGTFPTNYKQLCTLPGIGPYTAAAIASIVFHEPIALVDGNVYRVLARIFGQQDNIQTPQAQKKFTKLAQSLLDTQQPGIFNQALMEFGALHCTPAQPRCNTCIFSDICIAKKQQLQHILPIKTKKAPLKNRFFHYFIFTHQGKTYFKKRTQKDIWHGLYDFHLIEKKRFHPLNDLHDTLLQHIQKENIKIFPLQKHPKHLLTHQCIHTTFFHIPITNNNIATTLTKHLQPFTIQEIHTLPLPSLIVKFLKNNLTSLHQPIDT